MRSGRWIAVALALCACLVLAVGAPAQEKPPIKLGVIFIMSGPMGGYGKHGVQSIQMAMDEINAGGGILGRKLTMVSGDDKLDPKLGVEIATRFIKEDKVDFLIGPT